MKRSVLIQLAILGLLVAACGEEPGKKEKDEEEEFAPIVAPANMGYPCDPESVVTWENFAEGWITRQCTGCHSVFLAEGERASAPVGIDFNTYEMVRTWADRMFLQAAFEYQTMPPAGGPYLEDRILFGKWLACQAPRERDLD